MKTKKIIIIDDDPEIVELLSDILQSYDYSEIKTEICCYKGLALAGEMHPDLMILGYNNADINGDIACESIKRNQVLKNMRILGMSGNCDGEKAVAWIQAGADAFISKPFTEEELLAKIETLFSIESKEELDNLHLKETVAILQSENRKLKNKLTELKYEKI